MLDDTITNDHQSTSQKSDNGIGLKVIGKIDVSKFERPKMENEKN